MSTLPENNQKKINTPLCLFLSVHLSVCVCVKGRQGQAISLDLLGWFVSIPAVRYKHSEMVPVSEVALYHLSAGHQAAPWGNLHQR